MTKVHKYNILYYRKIGDSMLYNKKHDKCKICNKKHYALGYCRKHYNNLSAGRQLERKICVSIGCNAKVTKYVDYQLCCEHYYRCNRFLNSTYKKDGGNWGYKDYRIYQKLKKNKCEKCGSKKRLIMHHKDENTRNSNLKNIITWCKKCHHKFHIS